jgi:ribosomal protein S18 acetylase RimI-like enzyme
MDTVLIRPGRKSDIDALVGLLRELFAIETDFEFDPPRHRRGLLRMIQGGKNRRVWVAQLGGQVVGMCTAQVVISTAEGGEAAVVEDVVVQAAVRRKGIGGKLILEVQRWAKARGIRRLQLLADRTNKPALRFYRQARWNQTNLICLRQRLFR